jgi:hypothetical protein
MTARTPTTTPSRSRALPWIGGGLAAIALALAAWRFTSAPAGSDRPSSGGAAPAVSGSASAESDLAVGRDAAQARSSTGASLPAPRSSTPSAASPTEIARARGYRATLPPVLLAEYRAAVATQLEEQRARVLSACAKEGLPRGRRSATLTYNLTFDPEGREVGRGMVQDRRAPAGKLGKCLGRLPAKPTSIAPPGTYVSFQVPVTYP